MPEGLFGFPRVTSIAPFVDEDAEQEFIVTVNEFVRPPMTQFFTDLYDKGILSTDRMDRIFMELVIREPIKTERKGILGEIEKSIQETTREVQVSTASYNYFPNDNIAVVNLVEVKEEFREAGIGTTIKEKMMDDMEDREVNIAFTRVVSPEGRSLATRTGFTDDREFFPEDDRILVRRF